MSGREWQPGDVAMVNDTTGGPERIGFCIAPGITGAARWRLSNDETVWSSVSKARPLVVIDPEDREQVERLMVALRTQDKAPEAADIMQAALRSLITPPKPPEPTGLGAVVEDAAGVRWIRVSAERISRPWARHGNVGSQGAWVAYADLSAVRELAAGWSE